MSSDPRPPYDLTTAAHDYPLWIGPPRRTIVIASSPRSGSTLLGEAMYEAAGLGCPLEYLHGPFREGIAPRWSASELPAYVDALWRHRTSPNGVMSIKLFWGDIERVVNEARGAPGETPLDFSQPNVYRDIHAQLSRWLPNAVFVHLVRRDRVRGAISAYVAHETGIFRAFREDDLRRTRAAVPYDYRKIVELLGGRDRTHAHWTQFFSTNGITPLAMTYEDLSSDYAGTVAKLFAWLGHDGAQQESRSPRLKRQSAEVSETLLWQFLRDESDGRRAREFPESANG